jgi:glycine cleavage system aminomethyltransferase T
VRALFGEGILDLEYYFFREAKVKGIPVIVTRTGWTSEVGYEIYLLDPARGTELWEEILKAGAPYNIRPTGPSDIRRIEGGIFNWGADMTYEHNPLELGLERLVDFGMTAQCVAMDALRKIRDRGVTRRITGVELDGDPFPALPGFIIGYNQVQDGPLSSAAFVYAATAGWSLVSFLAVTAAVLLLRLSSRITLTLIAAAAGGLCYWYAGSAIATQLDSAIWLGSFIRIAGVGLVGVWLLRTLQASARAQRG